MKKLASKTIKGIFAGFHFHSGGAGGGSGDDLVCVEESLRTVQEWRYAHACRIRDSAGLGQSLIAFHGTRLLQAPTTNVGRSGANIAARRRRAGGDFQRV